MELTGILNFGNIDRQCTNNNKMRVFMEIFEEILTECIKFPMKKPQPLIPHHTLMQPNQFSSKCKDFIMHYNIEWNGMVKLHQNSGNGLIYTNDKHRAKKVNDSLREALLKCKNVLLNAKQQYTLPILANLKYHHHQQQDHYQHFTAMNNGLSQNLVYACASNINNINVKHEQLPNTNLRRMNNHTNSNNLVMMNHMVPTKSEDGMNVGRSVCLPSSDICNRNINHHNINNGRQHHSSLAPSHQITANNAVPITETNPINKSVPILGKMNHINNVQVNNTTNVNMNMNMNMNSNGCTSDHQTQQDILSLLQLLRNNSNGNGNANINTNTNTNVNVNGSINSMNNMNNMNNMKIMNVNNGGMSKVNAAITPYHLYINTDINRHSSSNINLSAESRYSPLGAFTPTTITGVSASTPQIMHANNHNIMVTPNKCSTRIQNNICTNTNGMITQLQNENQSANINSINTNCTNTFRSNTTHHNNNNNNNNCTNNNNGVQPQITLNFHDTNIHSALSQIPSSLLPYISLNIHIHNKEE